MAAVSCSALQSREATGRVPGVADRLQAANVPPDMTHYSAPVNEVRG